MAQTSSAFAASSPSTIDSNRRKCTVNGHATADRSFKFVGGSELALFGHLTDIFNKILEPLYGPQGGALQKIRDGRDRRACLLLEAERPIGVLQYKTDPSDEYSQFGITKSMEIKSLFVCDSSVNSGRGLGSTLLKKALLDMEDMGDFDGCHLTVSETKLDSFNFFLKKGFEVRHCWEERYKAGTKEYLLHKHSVRTSSTRELLPKASNASMGNPIYEQERCRVDRSTFKLGSEIDMSAVAAGFLWSDNGGFDVENAHIKSFRSRRRKISARRTRMELKHDEKIAQQDEAFYDTAGSEVTSVPATCRATKNPRRKARRAGKEIPESSRVGNVKVSALRKSRRSSNNLERHAWKKVEIPVRSKLKPMEAAAKAGTSWKGKAKLAGRDGRARKHGSFSSSFSSD
jgi:hypothetical protein